MHSPKKKKNLSSNTHQTEHVQSDSTLCLIWKKGRIRENKIKQPSYTMQRINPLGSTVSIASMLYSIYRLILLLWV
ncbi:unnamed protein product [Staurois parvus]|uniref:Uncharacterized protein n=1 Tax=Staurois parvus TaxID=386267 RepID=A0ABN9HNQ4_9NEOB|nr:unnamed protein product [Staurois parvus]